MLKGVKLGIVLMALVLHVQAWSATLSGMKVGMNKPVGPEDFNYKLNQRRYLIDEQDSKRIVEIFRYLKKSKNFGENQLVQGQLPTELMLYVADCCDIGGLSKLRAMCSYQCESLHSMWWKKTMQYWGARILNDRALPVIANGLLDIGLNPDTRDQFGNSLLCKSSYEVCVLLLTRRADVNAIGKTGLSPLHFAAENGNKKKVALFLKASANKTLKNRKGKTAAESAYGKGHMQLGAFISDFSLKDI